MLISPSDRLTYRMDSDICPADQSNSESSDTQWSDSVPVNEASGVEVSRRTVAALPGSEVEDLDSFNMIEPPPLDWRSDSSSEAGSADDLDDPSFPPSVDSLDKANSEEPVLVPSDISDPVAQIDTNQQELVQNNSEPEQNTEVEVEEEDVAVDEEEEVRQEDLEGVEEEAEEEEDEKEVTFRDMENIETEEEVSNRTLADEDHSRIHSLLSQLQLMGEEPHPDHLTPSHHDCSSTSEQEACASSLITDNSTETTGLLFSESHQRDVLGLLQCTEIGARPRPTSLPHIGEVDAVVSVSYSQDDAQRYWGHYGNGQHQRHREDSLSSLPDEEYPEPVWMKLGEAPPDEEAAADSEKVGQVENSIIRIRKCLLPSRFTPTWNFSWYIRSLKDC